MRPTARLLSAGPALALACAASLGLTQAQPVVIGVPVPLTGVLAADGKLIYSMP